MLSHDNMKSSLRLENLYFERILFEAFGEASGNEKEADIGFKLDAPVFSEQYLSIKLRARVSVEDIFRTELCLVGKFEPSDKQNMAQYVPNAVAIMFPYLRSQITLITAQPNIPTIVLPAININKLLENCINQYSCLK